MEETEKDEKIKNAQEILKTVKEHLILLDKKELEYDACNGNDELAIHKFITQTCGISNYEDYEEALKISERGNVLILKRSVAERNVNNYHPTFLKAWNANLDVQLCIDAHAVVTYITDYFSKGDAGFTQLLKKAIKDTRGQDKFTRLNEFKKLYFTHRQVCVAEAAYRLIPALHVKYSNIHVTFLATGFPKNRICIAKKVSDENAIEGDEEIVQDDEEEATKDAQKDTFTIEGRDGQYTEPVTIHDKYAARPKVIENICLAQFVVSYEVCHRIQDAVFDSDLGDFSKATGDLRDYTTNEELPLYIKLNDGKTKMRLRKTQQVLRIHASRHKKSNHEQTYSELLLFYPWTDEKILCADNENDCKKLYLDHEETIEINRKKIFPFSKTIEVLQDMVSDEERPAHVYDNLDAEGQQDNLECEEEMEPLDTSELPDEPSNQPEIGSKNKASKKESCIVKPIVLESDEQMLQNARALSFDQKVVFNFYIDFVKKILIQMNGKPIDIEAPKFIVTGNSMLGLQKHYYVILYLIFLFQVVEVLANLS